MTASASFASKLGIDSSNPVTAQFDFLSCSLGITEDITRADGMSGTRSRHGERTRPSLQRVAGTLEMEPSAVELALLLPWILGANASGTTFALAETLQTRYVTIDRVAKVHTYDGVGVDTATFSCAQGEPLKVNLGLVGISETEGNAGTFPSLAIDLTTQPFILSDLVLVVGGTTVQCKNFDVTINNMIDKDRFFNSNTLAGILALDRRTTFKTMIPYDTAYTTVYRSGETGAAVTATLTNGNTSLVFTMANLIFPARTPQVPNRKEVMLEIEGEAFMTGTTKELVLTLDSTP